MGEADAAVERERLGWGAFGVAARDLARQIADDGYRPDLILSVARGGLLVGATLGYALDVKNTWTMNVEFYTGIDERLDVPMILPPVPELVDLETARMLIADDVADTGETLRLVKEFCAGKVAEVRCAVLYEKPHSTVRMRVRLEAHIALDRFPVERGGAGRRRCAGARSGVARPARARAPSVRAADARSRRRTAAPGRRPTDGLVQRPPQVQDASGPSSRTRTSLTAGEARERGSRRGWSRDPRGA